jgi:hypothetical protein
LISGQRHLLTELTALFLELWPRFKLESGLVKALTRLRYVKTTSTKFSIKAEAVAGDVKFDLVDHLARDRVIPDTGTYLLEPEFTGKDATHVRVLKLQAFLFQSEEESATTAPAAPTGDCASVLQHAPRSSNIILDEILGLRLRKPERHQGGN